MTTIAEMTLADDLDAWRGVGFTVTDDGTCQIGTVRLRIVAVPEGGRGRVTGWTLAGLADESATDVDGLPTTAGDPPPPGTGADHPIGAIRIDHVVVMTPDLDRTVRAVERTLGLPLKRTREGEAYGQPMRQAFFRMGEVILEVVGPPETDGSRGDGPAGFFGLAVTVASLDAACDHLGPDLVSAPKPAVQEGRSIATIRSAAGLAVPVALMSA